MYGISYGVFCVNKLICSYELEAEYLMGEKDSVDKIK